MTNQSGHALAVCMLVCCGLPDLRIATAQLSNKPPDKNSDLFDVHTNFISDTRFAALISNRFFSGGTTTVRDTRFLFQQRYGGGMRNEIQRALGTTHSAIPWVGGSASSWYEPSHGFGNFFTGATDNLNVISERSIGALWFLGAVCIGLIRRRT